MVVTGAGDPPNGFDSHWAEPVAAAKCKKRAAVVARTRMFLHRGDIELLPS